MGVEWRKASFPAVVQIWDLLSRWSEIAVKGSDFLNLSVGEWQTDFTDVGPSTRVCVNGSALMDAVRLRVDSV